MKPPPSDGTIIRPYEPKDRPAVERICVETGLAGRLKEFFCDEEMFVKIWLGPYLDIRPDWCWVSEKEGRITGYVVCCFDDHFNRRSLPYLLPLGFKLAWRWMTGRYRSHKPTGTFIKWLFLKAWRESPKVPKPSAHFHFNTDRDSEKGYAGFFLGRKFVDESRERGRPQWHAVVFAEGQRKTLKFYRRMGFSIFDSRPVSLFGDGTVFATIVKDLGPESTSLID